MFGKPLSAYLRFQWGVLAILTAVGLLRLGLSLSGLPDATVRWLAMNAVMWAGVVYYGIAVHTRGFGSYKHLLPLVSVQTLVFQAIAVLGILLAIAGYPNIYAAPEYSFGAQSQWRHAAAHLTIGLVVPILAMWGVSSLVLLITKKAARRPAVA